MRFQTAAEMHAALTALMEQEGPPRPDDLSEFVRKVEQGAPAATGGPTSTDRSSAESSRTEAATVRETG
jgi:hypothetical protein